MTTLMALSMKSAVISNPLPVTASVPCIGSASTSVLPSSAPLSPCELSGPSTSGSSSSQRRLSTVSARSVTSSLPAGTATSSEEELGND